MSGAVAPIEAALDVLAGVDLAALSATDLVGVAERYETLVRRHRVACGDLAVELSRRSTAELGGEAAGAARATNLKRWFVFIAVTVSVWLAGCVRRKPNLRLPHAGPGGRHP